MKKSPKFALIAVVAGLLALAVIGVSVSFSVKSFVSSIDDLEDKWGSLTDEESDLEDGSDTGDQDSENVGGSDENGSGVEKTKFTLADGDIRISEAEGQGSQAGTYAIGFVCDKLKPNTKYSVRWSFDSSLVDVPAYFFTENIDGSLHYVYTIRKDPAGYDCGYVKKTEKSFMLQGDVASWTKDSSYLGFMCHMVYANTLEECKSIEDQYLKHVNYIEIVEVTS